MVWCGGLTWSWCGTRYAILVINASLTSFSNSPFIRFTSRIIAMVLFEVYCVCLSQIWLVAIKYSIQDCVWKVWWVQILERAVLRFLIHFFFSPLRELHWRNWSWLVFWFWIISQYGHRCSEVKFILPTGSLRWIKRVINLFCVYRVSWILLSWLCQSIDWNVWRFHVYFCIRNCLASSLKWCCRSSHSNWWGMYRPLI